MSKILKLGFILAFAVNLTTCVFSLTKYLLSEEGTVAKEFAIIPFFASLCFMALLAAALRSSVKEGRKKGKGCEYCSNGKPLLMSGNVQVSITNGIMYIETDQEESVFIKNCPMCGNKLKNPYERV